MKKTIEDLNLTEPSSQKYHSDGQILFESNKDSYKQIHFIVDVKKDKLYYLVTLTSTKNRSSVTEKEIKCKTITKALEEFNNLELL